MKAIVRRWRLHKQTQQVTIQTTSNPPIDWNEEKDKVYEELQRRSQAEWEEIEQQRNAGATTFKIPFRGL